MKKVMKRVVDVLAWIILILAFLITILVFSSSKNNGIPSLFGVMQMTVESDSMSPTFKKGDLIFVKEVDLYDLKKDDVITFYTVIEGARVKNTHRITDIVEEGNSKSFITKGDNNPVKDEIEVKPADIIGRWTGVRIAGGGNVLDFLRSKTGFFICIVIPMALFFLFELYKFIVVLIQAKKPTISQEEEDEIKRKAIEEYLAKEKAGKGESDEAKAEDKAEDKPDEKSEDKPAEPVEAAAAKAAEAAEEAVEKATDAAEETAEAAADKVEDKLENKIEDIINDEGADADKVSGEPSP